MSKSESEYLDLHRNLIFITDQSVGYFYNSCACVGFLQGLQFPPTVMHVRLAVDMNVSVVATGAL